jgi:hypothetical protein
LVGGFLPTKVLLAIILVIRRLFRVKEYVQIHRYMQKFPIWIQYKFIMAKSPAWQRKEGKNPEGGLNAKGRASAKAQGMNLKRPQPEGGSRRDSFCARMSGMKKKLTSEKTANDPNSRINKSLRAWNCADGGYVTAADGCATKGKTKGRMV